MATFSLFYFILFFGGFTCFDPLEGCLSGLPEGRNACPSYAQPSEGEPTSMHVLIFEPGFLSFFFYSVHEQAHSPRALFPNCLVFFWPHLFSNGQKHFRHSFILRVISLLIKLRPQVVLKCYGYKTLFLSPVFVFSLPPWGLLVGVGVTLQGKRRRNPNIQFLLAPPCPSLAFSSSACSSAFIATRAFCILHFAFIFCVCVCCWKGHLVQDISMSSVCLACV